MSKTKGRDRFMTPRQVADLLAVRVETVRTWSKQGKIPSVKLSHNCLRFRPDDVQDFIRRHLKGKRTPESEKP